MTRTQRYAYWGLPILFCLFVFWYGLKMWFYQDDFAWLSLPGTIHSWHDFWDAVLAPKAQGTIRPWSERLYFLTFNYLFGFDARPYRLWVFLNQFVNLTLLSALVYRLTNSRVAGLAAPILWTANTNLVVAMSWTSAYNEIQCSGFLLGALYLFVRFSQTGEKRYLRRTWVVFVLGFGSLELNVVFPALALVYALCCAPRRWVYTAPMFAASGMYALIHRSFAPAETSWFYRMYFDASLLRSFATYWNWVIGAGRFFYNHAYPAKLGTVVTVLLSLALLAFVAERLWRRQWVVLLGPAWYLIVLAPVLPLRNHVTEYYLTIPVIGIAILGAYAIGVAWQNGSVWRGVAIALALVYLGVNVPETRMMMKVAHDKSKRVEMLVESVVYAHRLHPQSVLLLQGVNDELFWGAVFDRSFYAYGVPDVYLAPQDRGNIHGDANLGAVDSYFLPDAVVKRALPQKKLQVYEITPENLRNITHQYARTALTSGVEEKPRGINFTSNLFEDLLGPGWSPFDGGYRWTGKSATVYLGGPQNADQKLHLMGICPEQALTSQSQQLKITVNGLPLPPVTITRANANFDLSLPLPASLVGANEVEVVLTVDHTVRVAPDPRELGVALGNIAIQ